jgi:hypothetical protein
MRNEQADLVRSDAMSASTFQQLLDQRALEEGERVMVLAPGRLRTSEDVFEEVALALTDRRLIVASPDPSVGFKITTRLAREHCFLLNHAERSDLSSLLVVCHPYGVLCLFLEATWFKEAEALRRELSPKPIVSPTSFLSPRTYGLLRDVLEAHWREASSRPGSGSGEIPISLHRAVGGVSAKDVSLVDEAMAEFRGLGALGEDEEDDL